MIKADAGTHGKMIMLSKNREELDSQHQRNKALNNQPSRRCCSGTCPEMVLRLTNNRFQRKRQTARLLPHFNGTSWLQRFPHQHFSWQLGFPRQTALEYSGVSGEMRQNPWQRQRSMDFRIGCHGKC